MQNCFNKKTNGFQMGWFSDKYTFIYIYIHEKTNGYETKWGNKTDKRQIIVDLNVVRVMLAHNIIAN